MMPDPAPRNVLVIGGYGLIGAEICHALDLAGHQVTALGRDAAVAARVLPGVAFRTGDLRDLTTPEDWAPRLIGMDFVVNAAGALQDMPGDDLAAVHEHAVDALARACAGADIGLIQISAAGVSENASTEFFTSKARGDAAIGRAGGKWWIFRPGLVLAPTGYGGTLLLRMLAAFPLVQPIALADAPIQTIAVNDVALAVLRAVAGDLPPGDSFDLVEDTPHKLADLVAAIRVWLGFAPARRVIRLPRVLTGWAARLADGLGRLGWRSPLRSTAMQVLADGVAGDPARTRAALGRPALPLHETLAVLPARSEDRVAARMALLMPMIVGTLALFWFLSGLIGFLSLGQAAETLTGAGWSKGLAVASVVFWAAVDIALAGAILVRRFAKAACTLMIAISLIYLVSASLITPWLWADPLGPLIKVLPAILLALVARSLLEAR